MALHRELERYHTNEFTVTASAPMAGPYDMSGVELNDILSPRCPPNPYYAAYVLVAYQSVYSLTPGWSDLLVPPYDTTLPPLVSQVQLIDPMPGADHSACVIPALTAAKAWFDTLKR
jgi:hypothetical protein